MLNLAAIKPNSSGKYSPLLYKVLFREENRNGVFQRTIDPISGEPTTPGVWSISSIVIGTHDEEYYVFGHSLREILHNKARPGFAWAYPLGRDGCRDITDEFWAAYERDGRCVWDRDHSMSMVGDGNRWHYHSGGRGRRCRWCGTEQTMIRERQIEVVEKVREVWTPYCPSVPAAITWPRGSMGEEVAA